MKYPIDRLDYRKNVGKYNFKLWMIPLALLFLIFIIFLIPLKGKKCQDCKRVYIPRVYVPL